MDVRIGTPNEHLAKGDNDIKSPMYATGIGLVLMGFAKGQKRSADEKIKGHSKKDNKGNFFDMILKKGKEWLEDKDLDSAKDFNN
jgi:cell division ATPase FtsA